MPSERLPADPTSSELVSEEEDLLMFLREQEPRKGEMDYPYEPTMITRIALSKAPMWVHAWLYDAVELQDLWADAFAQDMLIALVRHHPERIYPATLWLITHDLVAAQLMFGVQHPWSVLLWALQRLHMRSKPQIEKGATVKTDLLRFRQERAFVVFCLGIFERLCTRLPQHTDLIEEIPDVAYLSAFGSLNVGAWFPRTRQQAYDAWQLEQGKLDVKITSRQWHLEQGMPLVTELPVYIVDSYSQGCPGVDGDRAIGIGLDPQTAKRLCVPEAAHRSYLRRSARMVVLRDYVHLNEANHRAVRQLVEGVPEAEQAVSVGAFATAARMAFWVAEKLAETRGLEHYRVQ